MLAWALNINFGGTGSGNPLSGRFLIYSIFGGGGMRDLVAGMRG